MEATVRTILKGTSDSRVRVLAQRNWVNQGDMNSLIAMVRDREMEIFNEDEYQKLNRQSTATVAALSQDQRVQIRRGSGTRFWGTQRERGPFQRGLSRSQGSSQSACWRCASIYHGPANCPNLDKVCHNCNRRGHLARTCSALSRQGIAQKRSHGSDDEEPKPKLAAITQNGDDIDEMVQTKHNVNDVDELTCAAPVFDPLTEEDAYVVGHVAGARVTFFIDSGAQVNTIAKRIWLNMLLNKSIANELHDVCETSDKTLRACASPGEIKVIATFLAKLYISKERPILLEKFYVIEEARSLLSFNTAARYSLLDVGLRVPISECGNIWQCELALVNAVTATPPKEFQNSTFRQFYYTTIRICLPLEMYIRTSQQVLKRWYNKSSMSSCLLELLNQLQTTWIDPFVPRYW
ncbi:uncharacterized protein LOC131682904 [Topomyia yanbarensis]|uniref:uncharacterized protein LOC131682904 n=1 Tax=Topomyia yanbarensis TaxID=2498891 RepID=UPI00273CEB9D|nr:uncharacterized protein LOC131682904 [Topomyia yanbarensis]XP_058820699.1 uncharacterized protein LOC131682904 [Topomyia yanbarensis]